MSSVRTIDSRLSKPGIERVQALADISRSALCCHSNETHAPITTPPCSAQLEGTPTARPGYIRVRVVVWECGDGQTDTQSRVSNIHLRRLRRTRNIMKPLHGYLQSFDSAVRKPLTHPM